MWVRAVWFLPSLTLFLFPLGRHRVRDLGHFRNVNRTAGSLLLVGKHTVNRAKPQTRSTVLVHTPQFPKELHYLGCVGPCIFTRSNESTNQMQQLTTGLLFVVQIPLNMFRASLCPSSGAYQLQQQQPLVYRRNVVVAVLLVVVGPTTTNSIAITKLRR